MAQPGILTHQAIRQLCGFSASSAAEDETNQGPVRPAVFKNIRSASYDLRVGDEYFLGGFSDAGRLTTHALEDRQVITLKPNELIVVRALEEIHLPNDMVAHLTLKMDLLLKGLIMANQSQVDAGYHGWIFALLYNLSNSDVAIRQRDSFLRLELVALDEASEQPYSGSYGGATLQQSLGGPVDSSLHDMRERVDGMDTRLRNTRWGFGALLGLGLTLLVPLFGSIGDVRDRAAKLEGGFNPPTKSERALRDGVETLCKEVQRLRKLQSPKSPEVPC